MIEALLTIGFGALAGGLTNSLAIWMLFHPYQPPRLFGRRITWFQGAVPKNKQRLASAIGRTVGNRLLTADDLARTVTEPEFRAAFDERLAGFLRQVLESEQGPISEILPDHAASELRGLLSEIAAGLLDRLDAYLASDDFHQTARQWAQRLASQLGDRSLAEILTPEREDALIAAAERWITEVMGSDGFERAIREYVQKTAERLLQPGRTFQEIIPAGLVSAFERAVSGYLPLALERLGTLLEDPAARHQVENALHELLDRFIRDLKFHQRVVAALVIPADTVDRVLVAIEEEGATKISEILHDPAVRDAMARGVNDAVVDFLRRPVTDVLGTAGDPSVASAQETVTGWALSLARDHQTTHFLSERLRATLSAAERRTFGDIFRHVPPDHIADALVKAARSTRARTLYREAADRLIERVLQRPIGRLADHLPDDAALRLERALADPLWSWIQDQVPPLARRIDIARRVEVKLMEYPTDRLEELIRNVTQRELQLIVRLGYVLGGFIGLLAVVSNWLVG